MSNIDNQVANDRQVGGNHYKKFKIEIWDFIVQNNIPYLEGNAIKYIARWREKGGVADIDKAVHYLQKLKETQIKPTTLLQEVDSVQTFVGMGMFGTLELDDETGALNPTERGW